MPIRLIILACALVLTILAPSNLRAQYLYMDSNGNGIHDSGDRVKKKGTTTVDVYLISNANRNGSVATCDNNWVTPEYPGSTPLQVFSGSLAFKAVGGTVTWGEFTRFPETFFFVYSLMSTDTEHHVFVSSKPGEGWLEPGRVYLGRLEVRVASGAPSLEFEPEIHRADGNTETTSFGSRCLGYDFDNTYKLGSDFNDTDGLAAPGSPSSVSSAGAVVVSPNPMNPTAKFAFATSRTGPVRVQLFDVRGQLARTVVDAVMPAGSHEVILDGKDNHGRGLGSGVYLYRLESADGMSVGRLTIMR